MNRVNKALASLNKDELFEALDDPKARYPTVHQFASPLYFEEFTSIKEEKGVSFIHTVHSIHMRENPFSPSSEA